MIGLGKMSTKEIEKTKSDFLEQRDKVYKSVQDFMKADYYKTEKAMNLMASINIEIRAYDKELSLRG